MENKTYEKLLGAVEKLPKEAIEKASKEITRKGYDTTGYQYQFLVNVFNEVLGLGNWGFTYNILKETEGKWANGKGFWEITVNIKVWIMIDNKKAEFDCVGGHKSEMHADALKGAITNGFKKTIAFFGVGKKAYEGTIDDDYRPVPTEKKLKAGSGSFCSACGSEGVISDKTGKPYCPNFLKHKSENVKYNLTTKKEDEEAIEYDRQNKEDYDSGKPPFA